MFDSVDEEETGGAGNFKPIKEPSFLSFHCDYLIGEVKQLDNKRTFAPSVLWSVRRPEMSGAPAGFTVDN